MKGKLIGTSKVALLVVFLLAMAVGATGLGVPTVNVSTEGLLSFQSSVALAVNSPPGGSVTRQSFAPGEITYYFSAYHSTEKWTTTPECMVDSVTSSYASATVNNQVERLTGNTCPGDDLGAITKVEVRAYAYGDSNDELYLRPEFVGGQGSNHITVPGISGGWGAYQDITSDANAPDWSSWSHVQDLECDVEYDKTGSAAAMYASKVEIRVTYSGMAPMGGSVVFVRATEGAIDDTVLTLNIEVSAGTDRVLVVGLAYRDGSVQVPTSILFNTNESFSVELSAADGGDAQCFLYYLAAPTETTANVVITLPDAARMVGYVAYFTGVDQNNPFTAATSENAGTNNAPTVDVSSAADEIVIDVMAQVSAGPDTIDSNSGTLICSGAAAGGGSDCRGGGQYQTGEATTTMLYGMSDGDNWNIVAGALQEPQAAPEITNTPPSQAFGTLEVNTTSSTAISYFTIENTGSGAVDITIHAVDLAGGDDTWDLSDTATPGENIYGLEAGLDDDDDLFDVVVRETEAYNELVNSLGEGLTQDWGLKLHMPTSVVNYDGQQMTATVTLVCSAS